MSGYGTFFTQTINMQQSHKSILNEHNASARLIPPYKKGPVKINGQISTEANNAPMVPAKPARLAIGKRDINASTEISHMNANSAAPVANTAETDEIEFLLEEIKDLEVPACRTDSEQENFEIAGSRVDLDLSLQLDSPIDTSWYYSSIILLEQKTHRVCCCLFLLVFS